MMDSEKWDFRGNRLALKKVFSEVCERLNLNYGRNMTAPDFDEYYEEQELKMWKIVSGLLNEDKAKTGLYQEFAPANNSKLISELSDIVIDKYNYDKFGKKIGIYLDFSLKDKQQYKTVFDELGNEIKKRRYSFIETEENIINYIKNETNIGIIGITTKMDWDFFFNKKWKDKNFGLVNIVYDDEDFRYFGDIGDTLNYNGLTTIKEAVDIIENKFEFTIKPN